MNQKQMTQVATEFNSLLKDMVSEIANIFPESIVGTNKNTIEAQLSDKTFLYKFIEMCILLLLPYRQHVYDADEDFFMNHSFEDDVKKINTKDTLGGTVAGKIFEFKGYWRKLNEDNKECIIQYAQLLCQLAEQYWALHPSNPENKK